MIWCHGRDSHDDVITHLNSCHHTTTFIAEISETAVNFLDTKVSLTSDGTISNDLYCKPTDSLDYLHYTHTHHTAKKAYLQPGFKGNENL